MNGVLPMGLEVVVPAGESERPPDDVLALLNLRNAARTARDFTAADKLREQISALGYEIRDSGGGPTVAKK